MLLSAADSHKAGARHSAILRLPICVPGAVDNDGRNDVGSRRGGIHGLAVIEDGRPFSAAARALAAGAAAAGAAYRASKRIPTRPVPRRNQYDDPGRVG